MARDKLRHRFADDDIRGEVKRLALRQLAHEGPQAISLNAIARELEVSGPALYRYVAGRDELLTELVVDTYRDLARDLAAAAATRRTPRTKLVAVSAAYRTFALEQPHRYRLLFRAPLPGYDAHADVLVEAAQEAMDVLVDALRGLPARAHRGPLDVELGAWLDRRGRSPGDVPHARLAVRLWSRLHGLANLEVDGNFASLGVDPAPLYELEVDSLLTS